MVCNACGAEVSDEVNFCPQCGAAVKANAPDTVQHIEVEKVPESLDDLSKIRAVDDVVKKVFPHFDQAQSLIDQANNIPFAVGCLKHIIFFVVACPILTIIFAILADWKINTTLLIILAIFSIIMTYIMMEKIIKHFHTNKLMAQANAEQAIAYEILKQNADIVSSLPPKYLIPEAIDYMKEMFETRRVHTINEALDKYDEYVHRMAMENAQSKILARQEAIVAAIKAQTAAIRSQTSAIYAQSNSIDRSIRNATDSINARIH